MNLIAIVLIAIAGIANAAMDSHAHHWHSSVWRVLYLKKGWLFFRKESWRNKYIDDSPLKGRKKWFFGIVNVPVVFMDLWHFGKSVMLWCLFGAFAITVPWVSTFGGLYYRPEGTFLWMLLIGRGVFGMFFVLFYRVFSRSWTNKN